VTAEIRLRRRVQFSETDVAGIVHFSNFFRYFEDAEHELWREAGLSVHPEKSSIGWPRVAASCEFHRPLKFEQEFEIGVRISDLSRRTITFVGEITRNGEQIATGSWKIACVHKLPDGGMRSAEIPAEVAASLAPRTSPLAPPTSAEATARKPTSI
jgi:acyl-CoA thioester hydrolase